jgi:cytochrome c556
VRKFMTLAVAFLITVSAVGALSQAGTAEDTIKKVMKATMKKGALCGKVASGTATTEQKKELLELFKELSKQTPPEGEESSWKSKTGALVDAAAAVVEGKPKATDQLKKAANCKACHDQHKAQ